MTSTQILRGRDVSAALDADGVHLTRSGERVDIPLAAVREVRAAGDRVVEIVLTDGVAHRVEGGNPTANAAFAAALTTALPERRDPAGSALVTVVAEPRGGINYGWLALYASGPLAFVAYAVWVGVTHGARVVGVVVGVVPLVLGIAFIGTAVHDVFRRTILRRRGITVLAEAVGRSGKKHTVYEYTDTDGAVHQYRCKRSNPRFQIAYDPRKPERAAHAIWLPELLVRLVVLFGGSVFWLFVGVTMMFSVLWD
ncbi:DUF3592 domain-containing protein [Streptomyces sp. NPDC002928]|uniref:DUF3592 domain-containing protein n=1 Tax=Streptomyces sp. NPDC002928 TaxID=3154440 RepID=UPI0033B1B786